MKKVILFFVFSIVLSGSLFAQKGQDKKTQKKVDSYIKAIESKITLSSEEKVKVIALKKEQIIASYKMTAEYKGTPELKVKRKESNKKFSLALKEAFGKERAQEIMKASKNKKKKKKKNKK